MNEQAKGKAESDILYSKSIKAGKRIYYIDVKKDRHKELYISITESKRVWNGEDDFAPVFEKHKIFLYREDLDRFVDAFAAAADYAKRNAPAHQMRSRADYYSESQFYDEDETPNYNSDDYEPESSDSMLHKSTNDFRFDMDF